MPLFTCMFFSSTQAVYFPDRCKSPSFVFILLISCWANVFIVLNTESQWRKKKKVNFSGFHLCSEYPVVSTKWFPIEEQLIKMCKRYLHLRVRPQMLVLKLNGQNFKNSPKLYLIMYLVTHYAFYCLSLPSTVTTECSKCILCEKTAEVCRMVSRIQPTRLFLTLPSLYRSLQLKKYSEEGSWLLSKHI